MDRTYLATPTLNGTPIAHAGEQPVFHHPLPPLDPGIAALLACKPANDARVAKAQRRARGADTFANEMSGAEIMYSEKVRDSLVSHRPDAAYLEDLWDAVTAALGAEGGMKLTVGELVQQVADRRAVQATECGDLPSPG